MELPSSLNEIRLLSCEGNAMSNVLVSSLVIIESIIVNY